MNKSGGWGLIRLVLAFHIQIPAPVFGMARKPEAPRQEPASSKIASAKRVKNMEWNGQFCSESRARAQVILDINGWEALWQSVFKRRAPDADFGAYFAVAVFLGSRPTGGYSVEFLEPRQEKDRLLVSYRIRAPGPGRFVIQAFTQPYSIRLFSKTSLRMEVQEVR